MSEASTSQHVSGRRGRTRQPEPEGEDVADNFRQTMRANTEKRNAAKNKNISETDKATHENIMKFLQENNQRKKVTSSNCFDTKTPLDLFNVDDMIKSNVKIQDIAIVLDSTQQIYGARVDRYFADVRGVQIAMTKGEFEAPKNGENPDDEAAKRSRKKKNPESGIAEMEEVLRNMGEEGEVDEEENQEEGENVQHDDLDFGILDDDWDDDLSEEARDRKVQELIDLQAAVCDRKIFSNASSHVVTDSRSLEIQNTDIDWLKCNPYFQKAMVGSTDDVTSSFHSLLSNGVYSGDGRTFKLHPRVSDSANDRSADIKQISEKLVRNVRRLTCNAMQETPFPIPNNFVLEVENRPKTGHRIERITKKSKVPRPTAMSSQDTTALHEDMTDRDMGSVGPSTLAHQDSTMFGASSPPEMESMNTESSGPVTTRMNSTINESGALRASEFELLPFDDMFMDEEVDIPIDDDFKTDGLEAILAVKLNLAEEEEDESKKVWRRGLLAEEWDDKCSDMTRECQAVMKAGVDSYVKALDYMVNADVVKMIFNKETIARLDSETQHSGSIEGSSKGPKYPTVPDRYFLLKKSDAYKTMYPPDTKGHFIPIVDPKDSIPIQLYDEPCEDEPMEEDEVYNADDGNDDLVFNQQLAPNIDNDDNGAMDHGAHGGEDAPEAVAFYNGENHEVVEPVENFALDAEDVPDLMANLVTEPPVGGVRPEMQAEIQNLGKADNSHWKGAAAAVAADSVSNVNKKRRERKIRKKITVDDFSHYFEPLTEADKVERTTENLCKPVKNPSWILKESQILMPEIAKESKPYIAFEFEALSRSGLMFRKKYGKLRFERVPQKRSNNDEIFTEDAGGNVESDCLNWLLSFSGFRCYQQDKNPNNSQNNDDHYGAIDDDNYFDDREEELDQNYLRQEAMLKMSESTSQKFMNVARETDNMRLLYNKLNRNNDDNSDNEGENGGDSEDFYGQNSAHRAKNLDAAKFKKCIAEVLNSSVLTTPNIVFMVNKLSDGTLTATGEIRSSTPFANESTSNAHETTALESVYRFNITQDQVANANEVLHAFNEVPDYTANENADSAAIDPSNPPVEKVTIVGTKTFLGVVLCAPTKMDDVLNPAALLSFTLHLANENGLQLVQDKRNRDWMNDFVFLNRGEELPESVQVNQTEGLHEGELWALCHDPCAHMASSDSDDDENQDDFDDEDFDDDQPGPSRRPQRGADKRAKKNLSEIFEDDEEEEDV